LANVGHEPERARFEKAGAGAAIEQEAHEVVLAEIRRDQEGGVALLVPSVRQVGLRGEQIARGLGVAATNRAEEIGDSTHESRARARARAAG